MPRRISRAEAERLGAVPVGSPAPSVPGNIDMSTRPRVQNADGTISTVRSMSFQDDDGLEVLIPTVTDDGRVASDDEAVGVYRKTGRHLGKFRTPEEATRFAESLHQSEAVKLKPARRMSLSDALAAGAEPVLPGVEPGAPLAKALREQPGPVVTVETPTGPARFTREGRPFLSPEEHETQMEGASTRMRMDALKAALSFLSGGGTLLDEGAGAVKAAKSVGTPIPMADAYRQGRGEARRDVAQATRDVSPTVDIGGTKVPVLPVAGAMLPALATPLAATGLGRVAVGGASGALQAAGASEADLTRGDVEGFSRDVREGADMGVAAGAAGEVVGAPLRALSSRLGRESAAATEATQAAIQKARDAAVKSEVGNLGRVVASQGNAMETAVEVLRSPHMFDDEAVNAAWAIVNSPEGKKQLSRAALNNINKLGGLFSQEDATRATLAQAQQAAAPAAVGAATAKAVDPSTLGPDLAQRLWRSLGQRAVMGAVGGAAGRVVDEVTGSERGTAAGALTGAMLGPGGLQMARNVAGSPAFQAGATGVMQRATQAGARGASRVAGGDRAAVQAAVSAAQGASQLSEEDDVAVRAFLNGL